ncbi:alpha/beta-hydrolase [Basidiobolus meristosporus CBS 931.73]|uniref:Alpha/beta-hydrolase n=1 Tax=Basidiobolus meristosporus CBS 931.73 TaxID=1314790 RepID=A0A1Y1YGE5_9FUNG|nr:alpha/beta-hydrolase [Basidiobolus meristosporus CBS 931.73]|eukprot:ORX97092.1 alpha/beta-hydrolase [Basidiobolus meristosporus CBS 931.73]
MSRVEILKSDGLTLVGVLENNSPGTKQLILLCDGFPATKNHAFFLELAKALPVDTFRFAVGGHRESKGDPQFLCLEQEREDLDAAIHFFTQQGYHIVGLIGHSKGGSAILDYASIRPLPGVKYLINISGIFDFEKSNNHFGQSLGNETKSTRENLNGDYMSERSVNRIPSNMPVLTCHGLKDEIHDVSHAVAFANLIPNHTLRLVEGANHNYDGHFAEVISCIQSFIVDSSSIRSQLQSNRFFNYTRAVSVEGVKNFRDAGGYSSKYGMVRPRYLFRSGELSKISDAGKEALQQLGIKRVVDVRSKTEIQRRGNAGHLGVITKHAPLLTEGEHSPEVFGLKWRLYTNKPEGLAQAYITLLEHGKPGVADTIRYILEDTDMSQPVVVHCAAGKDRTGLVVAVILWALGVDVDTICADYELTNAHLKCKLIHPEPSMNTDPSVTLDLNADLTALAETLSRKIGKKIDVQGVRAMLVAKPESLRLVLQNMQEKYGGPDGYLISAGITSQEIEELRRKLVLPIRAKL